MSAISDYLEDKLLDHSLGTASFSAPGAVYASLYTSNPGEGDTGNEVPNSAGYSRQSASFSNASGGSCSNSGAISWTASGGSFGEVTHMALHDSGSWGGGNLLWYGELDSSRIVGDGDTLTIDIGALVLNLT